MLLVVLLLLAILMLTWLSWYFRLSWCSWLSWWYRLSWCSGYLGAPDYPVTPDVPGYPGCSDAPGCPGAPGSPGTPDFPGTPGHPVEQIVYIVYIYIFEHRLLLHCHFGPLFLIQNSKQDAKLSAEYFTSTLKTYSKSVRSPFSDLRSLCQAVSDQH